MTTNLFNYYHFFHHTFIGTNKECARKETLKCIHGKCDLEYAKLSSLEAAAAVAAFAVNLVHHAHT